MATKKTAIIRAALTVLASLTFCPTSRVTVAGPPAEGVEKRVPWTTSHIVGSPDPPLPYVTEPAFAALKFNQCLDIARAPGSDRMFVVEQMGKIFSFPNQSDVASADLVVDIAQEIAGAE